MSIKEALEFARNTLIALRTRLKTEPSVQGRGWVSLGIVTNDAIAKADAALATLQPSGEMREAIARLADSITAEVMRRRDQIIIESDGEKRKPMMIDAADYVRNTLLASGLVQNEAGVRASDLADRLCTVKAAWLVGCYSPNSCARHQRCMYIGCVYQGTDIRASIARAGH